MLGVLAVAVLWMGLYPKPFTDVMHASVGELLRHVAQSARSRTDAPPDDHELASRLSRDRAARRWPAWSRSSTSGSKDPRAPRHLLADAGARWSCVALLQLWYFDDGFTLYAMQRMVVADLMGHLLGLFATLAMMVTLVYARPYAAEREHAQGRVLHARRCSRCSASW